MTYAQEQGSKAGKPDLGQVPQMLRHPDTPTQKEVEIHNATHLPFQPWCKYCIQGKSTNRHHRPSRREAAERDGVPRVFMDYMFLSSIDQEKLSPILVMKDMKSKCIFAHVVPRKGAYPWIIKKIVEDLDSLGYGWMKIVIRSDQEPSIVDLKKGIRQARWNEFEDVLREIKQHRKGKTDIEREHLGPTTILEESPVAESSSNGVAENAIRHVRGQYITMKCFLEDHIKKKLPITHPIWAWLMEWTAILINRYHVGKDHLTALQRHTGRSSLKQIAYFGEKVMYRILDNAHRVDKHEGRWETGIWLGVIPRTDEDLIGTPLGVVKAAAVKRLGEKSRWDAELIEAVVGYPWQPVPGSPGTHIPIHIHPHDGPAPALEEDVAIAVDMPPTRDETATTETREDKRARKLEDRPRKMYVTEKLVEQYGPTDGCPGCLRFVLGREDGPRADGA